jgi:predicted small secreted protein
MCVDLLDTHPKRRLEMMIKLASILAVACVVLAVSGCNTIEGAGKDVKAAGGAVEKAADKAKTY